MDTATTTARLLLSQIDNDMNLLKTIVGAPHNLHLWAADLHHSLQHRVISVCTSQAVNHLFDSVFRSATKESLWLLFSLLNVLPLADPFLLTLLKSSGVFIFSYLCSTLCVAL